ncbi:MAG: hypothetical protein IJ268_00530 [Proteobacteria bacterium]|nr:hypothetical protein [Pseudomonadota bacterium]
MSEIVLYDANPTVRDILAEHFATYGLSLVDLPALDRCEYILQNCSHPAVIVLDMSRQPECLPYLQSVIPKYINAPERCILTSTQPTALAPYMPSSPDQYFFKHVVERPFKRSEFFSFFESILRPYIASSKSIQLIMPRLCVNSSLSQITDQTTSQPIDESLRKEVDIIVSSTSNAVILEDIAKASSPAAPSHPQRPARASDNQVRHESSSPKLGRDSSVPRFQRESSAPKPVSAQPKLPTVAPPKLPKLQTLQNGSLTSLPSTSRTTTSSPDHPGLPSRNALPATSRPTASATELPGITARPAPPGRLPPRLPSLAVPKLSKPVQPIAGPALDSSDEDCTHFMQNDMAQTDNVAALSPALPKEHSEDDFQFDEENATQLATPALNLSAQPFPLGPPDSPDAQVKFSLYWLLDTLKQSLIHGAQYTLVWRDAQDIWVAFIDCGKFKWFEKLSDGHIPDASEYLQSQPHSASLPISELVASAERNRSLAQAFASLSLNMQAFDLSQNAIFSHFEQIRTLENKPVELYHIMPPSFLPLLQNRPVQPIDIFPTFFDLLRATADQCLPPELFNLTRFVRRAFRTHINASIQLSPEESDILLALHTPMNIPDLKRTGKRHVSDILYRLVLFEFVDFAT